MSHGPHLLRFVDGAAAATTGIRLRPWVRGLTDGDLPSCGAVTLMRRGLA